MFKWCVSFFAGYTKKKTERKIRSESRDIAVPVNWETEKNEKKRKEKKRKENMEKSNEKKRKKTKRKKTKTK